MRLSTYRKILFAASDLDLINPVRTTSCSTKWKTASFSVWNRLRSYERVQPAPLKRPLEIPAHIIQPEYVSIPYGIPTPVGKQIEIKTKDQITRVRASCRLVRDVMDSIAAHLVPGLASADLDSLIHEAIVARGAYPSPLKYRNYPRSCCISVNNVVCHGIPDSRPFRDGDIVSVDVTAYFDGHHGDHCRTFLVGDGVDDAGRRLVKGAEECRDAGISVCAPGVPFYQIGAAIEAKAEDLGFTVVPYFNGHGIGHYFHGPPDVKHYANSSPRDVMRPGMIFTVEPVICEGDGDQIKVLDDGWTAVTIDESRAAQFEHTVLITEDGVEALTC